MKYTDKELEGMTKAMLLKHISDLYTEIDKMEKPKKRIFIENAPDVVKDYIKEMEVKRVE